MVDPSSTIARPRAVARILADDDNGFTIIEVMVA
ncbi:MAG: hypothetical protein JWM50_1202, partial [Microbacteriaceae bacterium]|nr:hypothetical protein [Microbacteriaceae bacterium]